MNSKKCKQLRKMIYGDLSHKMERSYVTIGHTITVQVKENDGKLVNRKVVVNQTINHQESPRGKYLAAKKRYKMSRQNN